jgi:DNA anti-recombination protein RmuC
MPVTVTLSSKLQEALGQDVADELVEYLNTVDTTRREELKELMDQRFARFSTELAQVRAEIRSDMALLRAEMIKWMFLFWATTGLAVLGLYR